MGTQTVLEIPGKPVGYMALLRTNRDFRNLWWGQVVSELGDWFASVALLNLMLELTGRAQVVGWFFIIVYLPSVLLGPPSGVLVDRLDRKKLMIAMDLLRAVIVLGYLLVWRSDQIWIIYVIAAIEIALMGLFEPARTAFIPTVCSARELVAANALSGITWSTVLTIGAGVGGLIAALLGRNVCYVVNSVSFLASAIFISRVRQQGKPEQPEHTLRRTKLLAGITDIAEGIRYLRARPRVAILALVKAGWGFGGGILLILSVFGQTIFPIMGSGAAGIGFFYTMRGIGALLGPIVGRRLSGEKEKYMRKALTVSFFLAAAAYMVFGQAHSLAIASLALMVGHMGGSILWVFSTVLLQVAVQDAYRGRVFAIELTLMTLGIGVSNYAAGYLLDVLMIDPRTVATMLGLYFLLPGILWASAQHILRD